MIWIFWLVIWLLQLHWLQSAVFFGISWPVFVVVTLLMSRRVGLYSLSWGIIALGVIADISSHLPLGLVLRSYILLVVGVWLVRWLDKRHKIMKSWTGMTTVAIVGLATLTSSATSIKSLAALFSYQLAIFLAMILIVYGLAQLVVRLGNE